MTLRLVWLGIAVSVIFLQEHVMCVLFQIKKHGYEFAKLFYQIKDYDNAIRYVLIVMFAV